MESLLVLLAFAFVIAPIVLLFLVIGARRRLGELEQKVLLQEERIQQLYRQASAARTAEPPEAPAVRPVEASVVPTPGAAPAAVPAEIDYGPVFVPALPGREPAPLVEAVADYGPAPAVMPGTVEPPAEPVRPVPPPEAYEPAPPPAWLLAAKAWLFGGNLVAKVGLLILFFGVSFLLKYAAARVSVPIELRLAGIVVADIALLLWGWRIRASRASISLPVQGAALGILMLVTFGAFRLYALIPGGLAFALLFVLTLFTCLLAVLQDAVWLAVFGIVGGFAAPILTSTGQGSHIGLFSYYALLNAGVLAIALKRSWRLLNLLGFAFTFLIGTAWGVLRYRPEDYLSAQGFLILFFVFYVAIAILYAGRQAPRLKHYVDGTLVFGTPLLAFGLQYGLVRDTPFGLAFSALALGLFYTGLTVALWRRRGDTLKLLVESFLALGIVFGTLAIPFALDGRWTSAAWALEGAGIVWVGLRQKQTLAWVFGVLVQVGAWGAYVASIGGLPPEAGFAGQAVSDNLFDTGFLGGLLLALGAGFSSWAFQRQPEGRYRLHSRILLGWAAYWWFAWVLGSLNGWGEQVLASHNLIRETAWPPVHPLYCLFLALAAPLFARLATRWQWGELRWLAAAVWPGLLHATLRILEQLGNHLAIPPWPVWLAFVALWAASEWLLRDAGQTGWLLPARQPRLLRVLHALRTVGPWLILWPLGHHLVILGLQADSPEQAELLAAGGWFTAGSWARYLPAWAMMAYVALLIPRARSERWPTAPIADWYRSVLIPLGTLWSVGVAVIWNFTQNGLMAPLPYLPLLNPLDLTTGYAALLAVAAWRLTAPGGERRLPDWLPQLAAGAAYVWFNLMLLRSAAHFLDIPYQSEALFRSQFVQAMLSLVWSATALVLMRFAARRLLRKPWMAGAGLLGLVIGKLFLVDLSNVGGIERIVSFLGVGVLMLAIGYLAPFPTEPTDKKPPVAQ
ncbi:MAG: DUF2339 domain-containing protein [Proteobacteria bacterium]|nr:DUF2339 domain-containing protein [Pseudomonadota bacterium]